MNPIKYGVLPPLYHVNDHGKDPIWDLTTFDVYDQVWGNTFEELYHRIFWEIALEIIAEFHMNDP